MADRTDCQLWSKSPVCLLILFACGALHAQQRGAVASLYSAPQGAPLVQADAHGNIATTYDCTQCKTIAMATPLTRPGYTGHINDTETQRRYYEPAIGLSADAAPPTPRKLNYMSRYKDMDDNPTTRGDPSSDSICGGPAGNCSIIHQASIISNARRRSLPTGSKGQSLLQKMRPFFDKDVDVNSGTVNFGENQNFAGETNSMGKTIDITFNVVNLRANSKYPLTSFRAETEATAAHEDQHVVDGQFFHRPPSHAERYVTGNNAYSTEPYMNEGLNYGLWHSGWQENAAMNKLQERPADENAKR